MTKTEQAIRESIARKGFFVGVGKRASDAVRRLERSGKLVGFRISYEVYNANGAEFKSQWNHPKARTAYEVEVSKA